LYYTASGIITPIGGCPVHRLREDWLEKIAYLVVCNLTLSQMPLPVI